MYLVVTNLGLMVVSKTASLAWLGLISLVCVRVEGQGLYTLDLNEKAGEGIYVVSFQVENVTESSDKPALLRVTATLGTTR